MKEEGFLCCDAVYEQIVYVWVDQAILSRGSATMGIPCADHDSVMCRIPHCSKPQTEHDSRAKIFGIVPSHEGKGLGRQLLRKVLQQWDSEHKGAGPCLLLVHEQNSCMRRRVFKSSRRFH